MCTILQAEEFAAQVPLFNLRTSSEGVLVVWDYTFDTQEKAENSPDDDSDPDSNGDEDSNSDDNTDLDPSTPHTVKPPFAHHETNCCLAGLFQLE